MGEMWEIDLDSLKKHVFITRPRQIVDLDARLACILAIIWNHNMEETELVVTLWSINIAMENHHP